LFIACDKTCGIKPPKDIKPIDWENYNDVGTVYWNLSGCCDDNTIKQHEGRTIKVYGWIRSPFSAKGFCLIDNWNKIYDNIQRPYIYIENHSYTDELQAKFDTCAHIKKCFIKGEFNVRMEKTPKGCTINPGIEVTNINDVYFE
jgi:hypothetical protein